MLGGKEVQTQGYHYKQSKERKKLLTRQLHHFDGTFCSIIDIKAHLMKELGDEIPASIYFDVGFNYWKRGSKCWLVSKEDLDLMYADVETEDVSLWCDADSYQKINRKNK